MLQFITDTKASTPVADQILRAIDGGCRWIEIRMDGKSDDEIKAVVEAVKPICIEKEVFLIMHSRVDLAKELNVGGVHLEKEDMPCSKARIELGPAAVIGVTVNTMADVLAVCALDIDYVAIAPYAKQSPYDGLPVLGIDGVRDICCQMEQQQIELARVATGGIGPDDALPLLEAGANGIAVSDAIAQSDDIKNETALFISKLPMKE